MPGLHLPFTPPITLIGMLACTLMILAPQASGQTPEAAKAAAIQGQATKVKRAAAVGQLVASPASAAKRQAVPSLSGKSCDEARRVSLEYHLDLSTCVPGVATGRVAVGRINGQSPLAGTPLSDTNGKISATTEPTPASQVRVPPLADQTVPQALNTLKQVGLQARAPLTESNDSHYVLRSEPSTGTLVPLGSTVRLVNEVRVHVPEVAGQSADEARALLDKEGLHSVFLGPKAEEGVVAQNSRPSAGTLVALGSVVQVPVRLTVPDLRNMRCEEARSRARQFGFNELRCVLQHQAEAAPDRVFKQSLPPNTNVDAPEALQVALPAPMVLVPNLRDSSPSDARAALELLKLKAAFDDDAAMRPGHVVDTQLPAAGERVDQGTLVRLHTLALVPVPDLTGLSCSAMNAAAVRVGLQPSCEIESQFVSFSEPLVVTQELAPGVLVRPGTVLVGRLRAGIPWGWIGGLAALLVSGAYLLRPASSLTIELRAQRDKVPSLLLHWEDAALQFPGLELRAEPGQAELSVAGLVTLGDSNGKP